MNFEAFVRFCTHFTLFPDLVSKSDLHRIFMSLAFSEDHSMILDKSQTLNKSQIRSLTSISTISSPSHKKDHSYLDCHLFIQALAFCGMTIDLTREMRVLPEDKQAFEKIFLLIEKIALSEGLK